MSNDHIFKVKRFQTEEYWKSLESNDLEERQAAVHSARNIVIGMNSAQCYFVGRGIGKLLSQCLLVDDDSEAATRLRYDATVTLGAVALSREHANVIVASGCLPLLVKQLQQPGRIPEATLRTLHNLCICSAARTYLLRHAWGELTALLELGASPQDGDRRVEMAIKVLGCMVCDVDDVVSQYVMPNDMKVMRCLARLLVTENRIPIVFGALECMLHIVSKISREGDSELSTNAFQKLASIQLDALFTHDVVQRHFDNYLRWHVQISSGLLHGYLLIAKKVSGSFSADDQTFVQKYLFPTLVAYATSRDCGGPYSLPSSHCLRMLVLLVRFMPKELGKVSFYSSRICQDLSARLIEMGSEATLSEPASHPAWCYAEQAVAYLTEVCATSEENCLDVCQLPVVADLLLSYQRLQACPLRFRSSCLQLMLTMSRYVRVSRTVLRASSAFRCASTVVVEFGNYIGTGQEEFLQLALRVVANMLLEVSGVQPSLHHDGICNHLVNMAIHLKMEVPPEKPYREVLLYEVLAAYRNFTFDVKVGVPTVELDIHPIFYQLLDESLSWRIRTAAVKLLANMDHPEFRCKHGVASEDIASFLSYFTYALGAQETEVLIWCIKMAESTMRSCSADDQLTLLVCLKQCLEDGACPPAQINAAATVLHLLEKRVCISLMRQSNILDVFNDLSQLEDAHVINAFLRVHYLLNGLAVWSDGSTPAT